MREFNLLEIIALHETWLYELLHPHVPFVAIGQTSGVAETPGPNPQPLPPKDWGSFGGAELATRISEGAVLAEAQTQTGGRFLIEVAKGWCGNEPRWPHGFPHPPRPHPHPDPDPWRGLEGPSPD